MLSVVNGYLDYLSDFYHHPDLHGGFTREWTRVGMTLTKSNEYTDTWRVRTSGGVVPLALFIILIVVFTLIVNVIKYLRYKQTQVRKTGNNGN